MTQQGKIVEYVEHGKFICASVVEDINKRLRVINQNGREVKLPEARVVHQSLKSCSMGEAREELQAQLKAIDDRRSQMMSLVNLAEIWELANEEDEALFAPAFLAELSFGEEASDDHVAAFLRCVFHDRIFFKYKEGKIVVHSSEVVEQLKNRQDKEGRKEELLETGAECLASLAAGRAAEHWPEREKCLELVRDFYLYGKEAPEAELARDLLKRAKLNEPHDVFDLLVKAGVWARHENVNLMRYAVPVEFAPAALAQAEKVVEPELSDLLAEGYRDLTDLPLLTIDGDGTRDFDDALHIEPRGENFLVGIHVADVARYLKPEDPLFTEAMNRGTSLYFADGILPMLPPVISEGVCSLIAGRVRAALSFMVLLSPGGEVLDYDLVASAVVVKRRLTYRETEGLLESDQEIKSLAMLSAILRRQRIAGGALLMPIPDVNIKIGLDDQVEVTISDSDSGPRLLVAEFMVLANTLGATFVTDREVPGLFRGQGKPHKRLIDGYQKDLYLNFKQRRFLRPGQLTSKPKEHACVGVSQYTTVTSPIRRFLDLVMQHQILSLVRGKGSMFSRNKLNDYIAVINRVQSKANLVRRLRHRYWILRYLEKSVGQRLEAMVIDQGNRRVNVVLLDCLLESDLPLSQGIATEPGSTVKVKVVRVSPIDDLLRLEW
ncbi:MAG: RNB domain-containing ribonuclease [Proteobacteria bacterium]|nr:RNB domain-containing ribonuclease [Pseudomonadota bacterium]MBU1714155.1 RNB domain-containing ribonuclease [Pseudomonadota bacterium]